MVLIAVAGTEVVTTRATVGLPLVGVGAVVVVGSGNFKGKSDTKPWHQIVSLLSYPRDLLGYYIYLDV